MSLEWGEIESNDKKIVSNETQEVKEYNPNKEQKEYVIKKESEDKEKEKAEDKKNEKVELDIEQLIDLQEFMGIQLKNISLANWNSWESFLKIKQFLEEVWDKELLKFIEDDNYAITDETNPYFWWNGLPIILFLSEKYNIGIDESLVKKAQEDFKISQNKWKEEFMNKS